MNLFKKHKVKAQSTDENLVMFAIGGDRDAFCQIVERYQNLLCSLAYSSVGQVQLSEDLAQETFIEAWKGLANLEDPSKLKAWLCGILRFRVSAYFRKSTKQPTDLAVEYSEEHAIADTSAELEQTHINAQQQTLMWQVLSGLDETYREPLVLYYRQQQSIEKVANELDLTTDTVKQRLSRGRKLLKEAMFDFVEDGLTRSTPSLVFTVSVMSAISTLAPPAKAATMATGAVKGSSMIKLSTLASVLAVFSGLASSFFGLRAALDQSRTQRERRLAVKIVFGFLALAGVYVSGVFILRYLALNSIEASFVLSLFAHALALGYLVANIWLVDFMFKATRTLRAHERLFSPDAFHDEHDSPMSQKREFLSKLKLFGVPLVHVQFGRSEPAEKPALAWIAGGSRAYGMLFAWGGIAVAPVSVGIVSVGVFTAGAVGLGLLATGAVAIGGIAFGASSFGYKAYASMTALGWESAFSNGFSMAKTAAIGPIAHAQQVNTSVAAEISNLQVLVNNVTGLLLIIAVFVIVPSALYARNVRKRMRVK
ncbi:RNA polymerase sigma factor [Reinekea blandensis]|uniref:RNA polymerase sigma factor n=1 Tax=Reinekea blandensis MED297 TaxID=314283 RepID=A4BA11_9GAMM|nr:sigma-70 family RNA polymerase sigma factor [Reinekea blandensis]EAR11462.1 RNA polymerase ECF-type sigma factor [Reinekea sp. MED297] [Reinekea blandensis MED297]